MEKKTSKILIHPDKDEIISRLTSGDSVRDIASWLKEKYSDNEIFQVSHPALDQFRRNHLNIHGTILEDLKASVKDQELEESKQIVKRNKSYDELKEGVKDTSIDWELKLCQFIAVAEDRFGHLFDMTQNNPNNLKPDKTMTDWLRLMLDMIGQIKRASGQPDQIIQHNVAIQAIDDQAAIFQQAIIKTLSKCPFEMASILIDDFNKNFEELKIIKEPNIEKEGKRIETMVAKLIPEKNE